VSHLEDRVLLAVPKKGRLQQSTLDLLSGSDIQFRRDPRNDIALVKNLPIALIFLPAADIPEYVRAGDVALGITGRDQVAEHAASLRAGEPYGVEEVMDLGFGKCKLQVQVPEKGDISQARQLVGKNVATSFTALTKAYFAKLEGKISSISGVNDVDGLSSELRTTIKTLSGSVETACALHVAHGVVDLVESGETMRAAGLKAIETLVDSSAVLIRSKNMKKSNEKLNELIASRIRGVITAQRYVLCQYNVPRTLLAKATLITPGKRAPTVTALDNSGQTEEWVAVSCMVEKKSIATVMDELTDVGATDVLVLDIMNTRTS